MHESYLDNIGFKGSKREEIAKRLGISAPQADRYNRFGKIIALVWDLVRDDKVSMFSVMNMSTLTIEEQTKIYEIFLDHLKDETRLTREKCEAIIRDFVENKEPTDTTHDETVNKTVGKKMYTKAEYEGIRINRNINRLNSCFCSDYEFSTPETAHKVMQSMAEMTVSIFDELEKLKNKYENEEIRKKLISALTNRLQELS
jgi:hypothetical protein